MGDVLGSVDRGTEHTVITESRHTDGKLWGQIRHKMPLLDNGWISLEYTTKIS